MSPLLTLFSALFIATPVLVWATPCTVFDSNWNLYAFGVPGQSFWNLGTQDTWSSSPSVTTVTKTNAPPFDGPNTQCYLSQFANAIYVLNGDASNPTNVYIYDATGQAWSMQSVTPGGIDPISLEAILDHDTNVFFGLSGDDSTLYQMDFSGVKASATGSPANWTAVETPNFSYGGNQPSMAIADNHIFFMGIPANSAGDANIFVIHYAYFQPQVQAFEGAKTFPTTTGNTTSLWQPTAGGSVQKTFAFFPTDGSATYVVDVIANATTALPAPPVAPSLTASFAGSTTSLVQLTPNGDLYFIALDQTNLAAASTATWTKISNSLWTAPSAIPSSIATTATSSGAAASSSSTGTAGHSSSSSSDSSSSSSDHHGTVVAGVIAAIVVVILLLGGVGWAIMRSRKKTAEQRKEWRNSITPKA